MIRKISYSLLAMLLLLSMVFINQYYRKHLTTKGKQLVLVMEEENEGNEPSKDRPDLAWQQEFELTKDPALGYVPSERLYKAYEYAQQLRQNTATAKTSGIAMNWTERGPSSVGGRTRTIMIDPNDATKKTIFAAGVNGGIWKTTDITATNPNWTPIDNFMTNLAVTTLFANPNNPQEMYAGTGEGYGNVDAARGAGVFKSTNGGSTWTQLSSTANSVFYYCNRGIVTTAGTVLMGTNNSIRRSTDGGTTWTSVITGKCFDIEQAANGTLYATVTGTIRKSTDDGLTWTSLTIPITANRIEISCAPNDANYIYALVENGSAVNGILKSTNGGTSWTSLSEPADADTGIPATDFSRTQAWYDLSIAVSPTNRDLVYVGGVDLFRTNNGGTSWTQVSHWYGGFGYQEVHADQHIAIFEPGNGNVVYFGNDGGVFRSSDAASANPTITRKNSNYNVTQFYCCAINPTAGRNQFLAGAQDNGSTRFTMAGINPENEVTGGDGAYCHIDQNQARYQWTSYVNNSYYRSNDTGVSFTNVSLSSNTGASFINPTDYDNVANIMYCSNSGGNFVRWTNPQSGSTHAVVTVSAFGTGDVTCINANSNTANRVFFGLSNGAIVRLDGANTGTSLTGTNIKGTGMPTGSVSCIEVQTGDDNHILATYSNFGVNSVWETTNGGTSWTSVEGNLPDMPIRWALFNPNNPDQAVLATELGVWTTDDLNGTSTIWTSTNNGLANTRVTMLQLRTSDKMVIASTHGRGLFSSDAFTGSSSVSAEFNANKKITYMSVPVAFSDASVGATSWDWDFDGDNVTDATTQNPTYSYTSAGLKTVRLIINGGCGTCTKTKTALVQVLPDRPTSYTVANGGNFESNTLDFGADVVNSTSTPWQLGNSSVTGKNGVFSGSSAWVTGLTDPNYADNGTSYLYAPNFDFSGMGTYFIQFQAKYDVETNWDGFNVEYSTNRGVSWSTLGNVVTDWYNYSSTAATAFAANVPFFTGSQGTYTLQKLDISSFAGNANMAFRLVLKSDATVNGPGVAIDDFEIITTASSVADATTLQAQMNLYPNPVQDVLNLAYLGKLYPQLQLSIYDTQGKLMFTESMNGLTQFQHQIPVNNLAPGIYFLQLQAENKRTSLKFVKW